MNITFVGGGIMAEAIISGILNHGMARPQDISVSDPIVQRRQHLTNEYGINVTDSNVEAVANSDIFVLAIKPQHLLDVANDIKDSIGPRQTAVSIVAGATLQTLTSYLDHQSVIRVMPNTPAQIGEGMSLWIASSSVNEEHKTSTSKILGTLGEKLEVNDESYMDMGTALSGSGPAFVFLFLESLVNGAVALGMPVSMAKTLAKQTLFGSAKLVMESSNDPSKLREMVTSPGGTTAEGIKLFQSMDFEGIVKNALKASYERAKQLGGTK